MSLGARAKALLLAVVALVVAAVVAASLSLHSAGRPEAAGTATGIAAAPTTAAAAATGSTAQPAPTGTAAATPSVQPSLTNLLQSAAARPRAALNSPSIATDAAAPAPSGPATIKAPPAAVAPAAVASQSAWASAVLSTLNSERAQNGLGPLASNSKLVASAHAHNLTMAAANTMSHQLPGEAPIGDRVTAAGYKWRICGENIGWTTDRSQNGALSLELSMYNETPPDDGHRLNILSTSFTQVGIDVVIDATHGKLWLTEDFGAPA